MPFNWRLYRCVDHPHCSYLKLTHDAASAFDLSYDKTTNVLTFGLVGSSTTSENVTLDVSVSAYGFTFNKTFSPCDLNVVELCPLPATPIIIPNVNIPLPDTVQSQIPEIAFQLPDLDATAKLVITNEAGDTVGCFETVVNNGKTTKLSYISWITAAVAGLAIVAAVISTVSSSGHTSVFTAHHSAPTVLDVMGYFQNIAYSGQLSINYPAFYLRFTQNFAWSTGIIPFSSLENSITNTRLKTGGSALDSNVTMTSSITKRDTSASGLLSSLGTTGGNGAVNGLANWANSIGSPPGNLFITALVVFLIVVGALLVLLAIARGVLEMLYVSNPNSKRLINMRRDFHYFFTANCLRLILIAFGSLATYAFYQFTLHDSWLAALLAGIALVIFGLLLVAISVRVFFIASKHAEGHEILYRNAHYRKRYGFLYNRFKVSSFYFFAPLIVYEIAKAGFIGLGQGHAYVQTVGLTAVELVLLLMLIFTLPYYDKTSKVVNIFISLIRLISYGVLIAFVEELGVQATPKAGLGLALLILQAALGAILAIMVFINLFLGLRKNSLRKYEERDPSRVMEDDDLYDEKDQVVPVSKLRRNRTDSESNYHHHNDSASPLTSDEYNLPPLRSAQVERARQMSFGRDPYAYHSAQVHDYAQEAGPVPLPPPKDYRGHY